MSAARQTIEALDPSRDSLCAACSSYRLSPCRAVADVVLARGRGQGDLLQPTEHLVPARRIVCRGRDLHDVVPVICDGWAASTSTLSEGSRQILSFLLPGDLVSTVLLFEPATHFVVEAIPDVRYRTFKRSELRAAFFEYPELFEKLSRIWIEEKERADQLAINLGRRSADERIARLILDLKDRLAQRRMVRGSTFDFPLRQHHVADAAGLTPVHVSKVLSEFRRNRVIEISDRSLAILDEERLEQIATAR